MKPQPTTPTRHPPAPRRRLRLSLSSHQRQARPADRPALLRLLARALELSGRTARLPAGGRLEFHWVGAAAMRRLNREHLGRDRLTDVIAFDYRGGLPPATAGAESVVGEVFVCPAVALVQAHARRRPPGAELVLYMVHGMLHLAGYDDQTPARRAGMRRAERRLMRRLEREFVVPQLIQWPAGAES